MLYSSIALFVLGLVAGLFALTIPADPLASHVAQLLVVGFLGTSVLAFVADRLWGAYALRRQWRVVAQPKLDRERFEGKGVSVLAPHSHSHSR